MGCDGEVGGRGCEWEGEGGTYLRQGLGKQHSEAREHDVWCIGQVTCFHHAPLSAAVHLSLLGGTVGIIQVLQKGQRTDLIQTKDTYVK